MGPESQVSAGHLMPGRAHRPQPAVSSRQVWLTTRQPYAQPFLNKFHPWSAPQPARVSSGPLTWTATARGTGSRTFAQENRLESPCTLEGTWSVTLTSHDRHHRLMQDLTRRSPPSHGCRNSHPAKSMLTSY